MNESVSSPPWWRSYFAEKPTPLSLYCLPHISSTHSCQVWPMRTHIIATSMFMPWWELLALVILRMRSFLDHCRRLHPCLEGVLWKRVHGESYRVESVWVRGAGNGVSNMHEHTGMMLMLRCLWLYYKIHYSTLKSELHVPIIPFIPTKLPFSWYPGEDH